MNNRALARRLVAHGWEPIPGGMPFPTEEEDDLHRPKTPPAALGTTPPAVLPVDTFPELSEGDLIRMAMRISAEGGKW
jgi:hypothetical protein